MRPRPLPSVLRCMNPTCTETVSFRPTGKGRQLSFCRTACRVQYKRERDLARAALSELSSQNSPDQDDQRRLAHLRWVLARYTP